MGLSPRQKKSTSFQTTIIKKQERDIYDRPNSEKLETSTYFKTEGNTAFKEKNYPKASYMYQKVFLSPKFKNKKFYSE